nr:hypothetical protein [Moraxella sp.]
MKADKEQLGIEFWERMKPVIGDTPYAWAAQNRIPKSSFQSAYERKAKPLNKTLDKWAELARLNPEWLKTGIGHPKRQPSRTKDDLTELANEAFATQEFINPLHLAEALEILEDVLLRTNRTMSYESKAEMLIKICHLLDNIDESNVKQSMKAIIDIVSEAKAS